MTQILVVNDWFANRLIKRSIQSFTVESIEFEIMALNKAMIDNVKACDSYEEMLFLAADNGLSFNGVRVIEGEELTIDDITALWGDELKGVDCDPCVRARVGEKVCEISGLAEMLQDMLDLEAEVAAEEEAAKLIQVGDHELPGSTALEDLPATDDVYLDTESMEEEAVANANY